MNKNAIKKYAIWARRELIERVSQRAMMYGITKESAENLFTQNSELRTANGVVLTPTESKQCKALLNRIHAVGFTQVMEEVAYTWFNRFAALRFMEVNGYLPSHVRVFTNDAGEFKPQILAEAIHLELDGLDMKKVYALENENQSEELFKYLLIVQCNALNSILPGMFQRIDDYTELLLPDYLLREGSVIEQLVTTIPEADWTDQVQIIGWLYQYYNTEPKDKVFADLKKNIKITKENIPAATQLFTPDWIVHYMVENSLGRLWIERKLVGSSELVVGSSDYEEKHQQLEKNLAEKFGWKYYLPEVAQEPEVREELRTQNSELRTLVPEALRIIDPCCGSGHILCVLFDILVQIYEDYGYTTREAADKIVENNLWGLDIDERAAQLSYFAVMMKARQYDRRFFTRNVQPHVYSPKGYPEGLEYGSLITVDALEPAPEPSNRGLFDENYSLTLNRWNFRHALSQKYHVVVTNPPYMGSSGMNASLSDYVKKRHPDCKADLFACFIERGNMLTTRNGFNCMVTMQSWMFLSSFEDMRVKILNSFDITNLMHMENMVMGIAFGTAVTVFKNARIHGYKGTYNHIKLQDIVNEQPYIFPVKGNRFAQVSTDNFSKIPGSPVAYWVGEAILYDFSIGERLKNKGDTRQGMATSDNNRFLRLWFEVQSGNISLHSINAEDAFYSKKKWFPYNKGGEFRKWYGNTVYLINYENDGKEIKDYAVSLYKSVTRTIKSISEYFKPCISWSKVSSGSIAFRYYPSGFIFDVAGCCIFYSNPIFMFYDFAFLNSKIAKIILSMISPTLNYEVGHIASMPIIRIESQETIVNDFALNCIEIAKNDWDSFETSWDFERHPLACDVHTVQQAYEQWSQECEERFNQLKANEEELNRIFIDIYGLQDELTPEVEDKDVTVRKADLQREIKSLISYAVGCMFGRYSLDKDGLVYAGGEFSDRWLVVNPDRNQKLDVHKSLCYLRDIAENVEITNLVHSHFGVDADNIIPVTDDEYFEDDIVSRFVKFLEIAYGKDTLEENLRYIADAIGGKGSSREVIRKYFLNDFFEDHVKIYQKRPIYWLFDSGKKNGFKCLIYMHRYQPDTIARIRTDYVHEQQSRYRTAIADLEQRINGASTGERVKLNKKLTKLQDQATELRVYEEKIHHIADQMIAIDLDDGVKVNYAKFQDVLAKVK